MIPDGLTPKQKERWEKQQARHKKWKITPTMKRRYTADWAALFPDLGVYKPMWLLRRAGPLLQGVLLERNSGGESYLPTFHVHCLARSFPVVSLTLCTRLTSPRTGVEQSIRSFSHDELYREAAERLRSQSLLKLEGPLRLSDVLAAFRSHMRTPTGRYSSYALDDMLRLMVICGKKKEALSALDRSCDEILSWPSNVTWNEFLAPSMEAWREDCKKWIANPDILRKIVQEQIETHKVGKLPVVELLPD